MVNRTFPHQEKYRKRKLFPVSKMHKEGILLLRISLRITTMTTITAHWIFIRIWFPVMLLWHLLQGSGGLMWGSLLWVPPAMIQTLLPPRQGPQVATVLISSPLVVSHWTLFNGGHLPQWQQHTVVTSRWGSSPGAHPSFSAQPDPVATMFPLSAPKQQVMEDPPTSMLQKHMVVPRLAGAPVLEPIPRSAPSQAQLPRCSSKPPSSR